MLRSTFCAQCWDQTRRTRSLQSTSAAGQTIAEWGCLKKQMQQAMTSTAPDALDKAEQDVTASKGARGAGCATQSSLTCWNVDRDARMEPPIQTLYLRSGGATTLTFMLDGARAVISLFMRSAMPGNMVVPPVPHPMLLSKLTNRQTPQQAVAGLVVASTAYRVCCQLQAAQVAAQRVRAAATGTRLLHICKGHVYHSTCHCLRGACPCQYLQCCEARHQS